MCQQFIDNNRPHDSSERRATKDYSHGRAPFDLDMLADKSKHWAGQECHGYTQQDTLCEDKLVDFLAERGHHDGKHGS